MSRKGLKVVLKEEKAFVTRVEINGSVRRETYVVSGMRVTVVQSRHPNVVPPSEPQSSKTRGRSESRKTNARGRSKSEKFNRPPCKYFLKATCAKSPCDWHPPKCQFCKKKSGCKFGAECSFPHWKVHGRAGGQPARKGRLNSRRR